MDKESRNLKMYCLFCSKLCLEVTPLLKDEVVVAGAVGCAQLQRQLQQVFILRQLLDIPVEWCVQKLEEFGGRNDDSNPESWFRICEGCFGRVEKAWSIYQQLLDIQSRFNLVKRQIKNIMLEKSHKSERSNYGGLDQEILGLLYPVWMQNQLVDVDENIIKTEPIKSDGCDTEGFIDFFQEPEAYEEDTVTSRRKRKCEIPNWIPNEETESNRSESEGSVSEMEFSSDSKHGESDDEDYNLPKSRTTLKRKRASSKKPKRKRGRPRKFPRKDDVEDKERFKFHWKTCTICKAKFKKQDDYDLHLEAHKKIEETGGEEFLCKVCKFPLGDETELERHMTERHSVLTKTPYHKNYPCKVCQFRSFTWKKLKAHVEEQHPDIPNEEFGQDLQPKCSVCTIDFSNRTGLGIHQRKMHPELFGEVETEALSCDQCAMKFHSRIHLESHVNNTHKRINNFMCDICGKGFSNLISLSRHKKTHQDGSSKGEFVCNICGCDYPHRFSLDKHYRKHHPEAESSAVPPSEGGGEVFKCTRCDLISPFKVVILRHMKTHKEETGFQCDICSKYYTRAKNLKRHKRINHGGQQVNCPYCSKSFPGREYMKIHVTKYCKVKDLMENQNNGVAQDHV